MSGPQRTDPLERFERYVTKTEGCWLWTGSIKLTGYGQFCVNGPTKQLSAHRFAYSRYVGPIPEGLHIDHLCRNRTCVNPAHLEPVTPAENCRRAARAKTHCIHGHEYTEANTIINNQGARVCRICKRKRDLAWVKAHKAAA